MRIIEELLAFLEGVTTVGFIVYWISNNLRGRKSIGGHRKGVLLFSFGCISLAVLNCLIDEHNILNLYSLLLLPVNVGFSFYLIYRAFKAAGDPLSAQTAAPEPIAEAAPSRCMLKIRENGAVRVLATELAMDVLQVAILCWKYEKREWSVDAAPDFYGFARNVIGEPHCFPCDAEAFERAARKGSPSAALCDIDLDSGTFGCPGEDGSWENYVVAQVVEAASRTFQIPGRKQSQHLQDFYGLLGGLSAHTRIFSR